MIVIERVVLIVDDEPDIADIVADSLQSEGFEILKANSVAVAIEVLQTSRVDLVLSDVLMPKEDGFMLLKKMKTVLPNPPPLIFMTGSLDQNMADTLLEGAAGLLVKPFNHSALLSEVTSVLEKFPNKSPDTARS